MRPHARIAPALSVKSRGPPSASAHRDIRLDECSIDLSIASNTVTNTIVGS